MKKISALVSVVVVFVVSMFYTIQSRVEFNNDNISDTVKSMIGDSAFECYIIECSYPRDLQYLKDNYGLIINDDIVFIDYVTIGDNIPPVVNVKVKGNNK